jgi:hypothetical protein
MDNGRVLSQLAQLNRGIEVLRGEVCCKLREANAPNQYSQVTSAASTNAGYITTTPSKFYGITAQNTSGSDAYVKIYDKNAVPTVGTDIPILTYLVPAGGNANFYMPNGIALANGLSFAITANAIYTDTTPIGSGDIEMTLMYA